MKAETLQFFKNNIEIILAFSTNLNNTFLRFSFPWIRKLLFKMNDELKTNDESIGSQRLVYFTWIMARLFSNTRQYLTFWEETNLLDSMFIFSKKALASSGW